MARVPPCVSYMFVTQKSGRVQILVLTPTLQKNKWPGYRPVFHIFLWLRHQAEYRSLSSQITDHCLRKLHIIVFANYKSLSSQITDHCLRKLQIIVFANYRSLSSQITVIVFANYRSLSSQITNHCLRKLQSLSSQITDHCLRKLHIIVFANYSYKV